MKALTAILVCLLAPVSLANAQTQMRSIRANVVSLNGDALTVKTAAGKELKVNLTPKTSISYPRRLKLSDLKAGDYVGSAAMPGPDGKLVAREVHVFPEAQRGAGEGHYSWDLQPGSTMTNGGVSKVAKAPNGQELLVQFKGGEKTIVVPPNVPVVTSERGDRSLLVPGAYVFIGAEQAADGTLTARYLQATSKDGVKPPV